MSTLARIVRAREALEDGDLYLAATILADLEEDLASSPRALSACVPAHDRVVYDCPDCHATFRWPGELDHHQRFVHFAAAA